MAEEQAAAPAMPDINKLLTVVVEKGASDLFLTAGIPPSLKLHGKVVPITNTPLTPEKTREVVMSLMNEKQRTEFLNTKELNFAVSARGIGRFRANAFFQRNLVGAVLRRIETTIPKVEDLGLPEIIKELAMTKRGLVIFVGATGTGKSTSLASMIGHRNRNSKGHIITLAGRVLFRHGCRDGHGNEPGRCGWWAGGFWLRRCRRSGPV